MTIELPVSEGKVAPVLRDEFPGLGLRYCSVETRQGRSPAGVKQHLRYLASRIHGGRALNLRREPIASAYRVFFRQIGLDPDEFRTPIEAAILERLRAGGFQSSGIVDDALTIATVETGVALRVFDADRVEGGLTLRLSQPRERLGGERHGIELQDGTLVLADERRSIGLIFGETAPETDVDRGTRRLLACAIQVKGVPDISVEEALWSFAGVAQGRLGAG